MRAFRLIVAAIATAVGLIVLLMTPRLFVQAAPNVICTWTGPKDSTPRSWSAASNWSCGKAPGAGDTAIVSGGGIVIDVDVPVTVQDLTLALNSELRGYQTLTVTGQMIWSSGSTIVGGAALAPAGAPETLVITPDAHATLATAGDARLIHGTLVNYGTVAHSEGGRVWALNAVFDNRTGGMYSVLRGDITDSNWPPGKAGIFNNAGTLLKQGSGEYRMAARLTNAGLIQVLTGTLRLEDGVVARPIVTHTGSFVVAPAGTLLFDNLKSDFGVTSSFNVSGTLGFNNGATGVVRGGFAAPGLVETSLATLQFERPAGAATLARLTMFGNDYLRGTNAITVTEAMTIAGQSIIEGTSSNTNTFNIAAGATLHVNQTGGLSFRTLNNHGSIKLAGGKCFVMINDAVFDNKPTGTYMVTTGQMGGCLPGATGGRQFNNQGRMVKEGPGQFGFLGRIDVTNTGTLEVNAGTATVAGAFVQKAGETRLRDGSALSRALSYPGDFIFDGGALRGTGTIALHLPNTLRNNGAVVDPIGVLTISDGNYSQAISGTLQFDIGGLIPNTQHDVLNVSGNASLNGSLILSPTHGFRPASGDAFNVMSYGSRNGEFVSIEHGLGLAFGPEYQTGGAAISDSPTLIELAQRPDLVVAPPSATNGFVVRMLNPDPFRSVTVTVQAVLPEGASYLTNTITPLPWGEPTISMIGNAQSLLWGAVPLAPMAMVTLHWQVIMPPQVGLYTNRVSVTAVQSPTVMRQLVASSSVAVAILPVSGTDVHASAGVLYPPVAPDQPWKIAFSRNATVAPNIVITTTPVCAFPACGPLVRMTALHNGVFYTMTETSAGSKRFTVTIPSHAYDFYEPVYLVPFWENPPTTARTPQAVDFICRMLGLGDIGPDGLIHTDGRCPPPPTIDTPGFFDPSGFVTDAVTGRPVVGATVTLYRVLGDLPDTRTGTRQCRTVDTRPGGAGGTWSSLPDATPDLGIFEEPAFSPATIDPPINPQRTDEAGHYGWDVIRGCWYIKVEARGYVTRYSALVGVPPEVTDLDVALEPIPVKKVYLPLVIR